MILYYSLSGVWQVFRFNDLPKAKAERGVSPAHTELSPETPPPLPSPLRKVFHELSNPHKSSTLPWANPKEAKSTVFNWIAAAMGVGLAATTILGLLIAFQNARLRRQVLVCVILGALLPVAALTISAR